MPAAPGTPVGAVTVLFVCSTAPRPTHRRFTFVVSWSRPVATMTSMRQQPSKHLRVDRIERYRAEAARLLTVIRRDAMKGQIGLALRDLQEGAAWVEHSAFETSVLLQQIADCAIENAIRRLAIINAAVDRHGPSVVPTQPPNVVSIDVPLQMCGLSS